jgi:hypothetical protein
MTNTGSTTPAGWYTDPGGSGHLRWWDGTAWSAHLAPHQAPAVYEPAMTTDSQPYVPFQSSWDSRGQGGYTAGSAEDFAQPAQWNTVWVWLLAFSTLLLTLAYAATFAVVSTGTPTTVLTSVAVLAVGSFVLEILFALADRRKLLSWGHLQPASVWWILLGPLFYLIFRAVAVRREVGRGLAPLITYIVVAVGSSIILTIGSAIFLPAFLASRGVIVGSVSGSAFASSLQTGLNEQGANYTVICPQTIPTTVDSIFSCTATPAGSGEAHTLKIEVIRGADGQPTTKLLSVTPPFSG